MTKVVLALCIGIALGAMAMWFFAPHSGIAHEPQ
jgi:hypothetical protein